MNEQIRFVLAIGMASLVEPLQNHSFPERDSTAYYVRTVTTEYKPDCALTSGFSPTRRVFRVKATFVCLLALF